MRRAVLVAVAAAVVLAAGIVLTPDAQTTSAEGASVIAARGPAVARYDAEADVTHAVFECGHWLCDRAVSIEGDARARLDASHVVLRASDDAWRVVAIEPLDHGARGRMGPGTTTTEAYAGPFAVEPVWWRLVVLLAGIVLAAWAVGEAVRPRGGPRPGWAAGAGALAIVATLPTQALGEGILLPLVGWAFLTLAGLALGVSARTRRWGVPLGVLGAAGVAAVLATMRFLPGPPAL